MGFLKILPTLGSIFGSGNLEFLICLTESDSILGVIEEVSIELSSRKLIYAG
jgi:hypothetical protein